MSDLSQNTQHGAQPLARFLALAPGGPAENMAIDQALLESTGASGVPVLRFYGWSQPTLSLGYFQRLADRSLHQDSESLPCVRRGSGGGAIVHHHELTYSIAIPLTKLEAGPRFDLYRKIHSAVIETLSGFGVTAVSFRSMGTTLPAPADQKFLCFQRRSDEDLIVSGYKVLGSAQRKTREAVLQHGSLLLRASRFAPQLPGVSDLCSQHLSTQQLADALLRRLGQRFGVSWRRDKLTDIEDRRASELVTQRFEAQNWMNRR